MRYMHWTKVSLTTPTHATPTYIPERLQPVYGDKVHALDKGQPRHQPVQLSGPAHLLSQILPGLLELTLWDRYESY